MTHLARNCGAASWLALERLEPEPQRLERAWEQGQELEQHCRQSQSFSWPPRLTLAQLSIT